MTITWRQSRFKMSYLLHEAIKINRTLSAKATDYRFTIVNSRPEEDAIDAELKETDFITVLRLYDRESN